MLCRENIFFFYFDFNNSILISFAFFGQHMRRLTPSAQQHFTQCERETARITLYPNVVKLINLAFIIPCSTASVERGSSWMNSLCTILRNRLSQSSFDSPKRICKEEDFDKSLKWTPEALWVQDFTPFILEFFRGLIWPWVKMF